MKAGFLLVATLALSMVVRAEPTPPDKIAAFEQLLSFLSVAGSKSVIVGTVSTWIESAPVCPIVRPDGRCTYVFVGDAKSVKLVGDFCQWNAAKGKNFEGRTGANSYLWTCDLQVEPTSRLDYKLIVEKTDGSIEWIEDPLNPRHVLGGFGSNSEARGPAYVDEASMDDIPPDPTHGGKLIERTIAGHTVYITMPPDESLIPPEGFPLAIFQDGGEYLRIGRVHERAKRLVTLEKAQSIVIAMVVPNDRIKEYGFDETYQKQFIEEILPTLRNELPVRKDAVGTLVAGPSMGGLVSVSLALRAPDQIGAVGCQSGYIALMDDRLMKEAKASPDVATIRWHFEVGTYETDVAEDDLVAAQERMVTILREAGADVHAATFPEGHSWGMWARRLDHMLEWWLDGVPSARKKKGKS